MSFVGVGAVEPALAMSPISDRSARGRARGAPTLFSHARIPGRFVGGESGAPAALQRGCERDHQGGGGHRGHPVERDLAQVGERLARYSSVAALEGIQMSGWTAISAR